MHRRHKRVGGGGRCQWNPAARSDATARRSGPSGTGSWPRCTTDLDEVVERGAGRDAARRSPPTRARAGAVRRRAPPGLTGTTGPSSAAAGRPATSRSRTSRSPAGRRCGGPAPASRLEDYINAFRVGQQVFWEAVLDSAGDAPAGHEAALSLATPLMRYCDFACTHAGHARTSSSSSTRSPTPTASGATCWSTCWPASCRPRGPLLAAAQALRADRADARLLVVARACRPTPDADAPHAGGAALARAALGDAAHAGGRAPGRDRRRARAAAPAATRPACARAWRRSTRACARRALPLAIGVSTLGRRRRRAAARVRGGARGARLGGRRRRRGRRCRGCRRSTTWRAARTTRPAGWSTPRCASCWTRTGARRRAARHVAGAGRRRPAAAACAAERLQVHPNTAQYRLRRIEERTGRNPRRVRRPDRAAGGDRAAGAD